MLVKIIRSQRYIVAMCDTELLGKKFEEGKFQLDIKENFFNGEEMKEEEAVKAINKMMKEDATFYIIGRESVNAAIKAGAVEEEDVREIKGIPFVLILL